MFSPLLLSTCPLIHALVQNMAKPPLYLPPTADTPLQVSLLIGSPSHSPLAVSLFDLKIPPSHPAPVHPDEASFSPLPEIHHTFQPDQKLPPRPISAIFSLVVLTPWLVLLGLVRVVALLIYDNSEIFDSGRKFLLASHICSPPAFCHSL
jgi:hypothetical protein